MAPVQIKIIPIADRHIEYGIVLRDQLSERGIRCEIDDRSERMNAKVRDAQLAKIPYMFIVGDREVESKTVGVRLRSGEDLGAVDLNEVLERIVLEVEEKIT